ncbi:copper amine oxidase N-terminal domain-containing protein [Desulfolucanica intricata]|uniref:copper amine oxidase N-terminal domain-containing protein n=1 Tax=Desulfolucanica intricata TaxID=1285191 RepID=UPI0013520F4E|nr:copper amine oxidase N-terminal domain-containing protein [Desulfolucanica intricata]
MFILKKRLCIFIMITLLILSMSGIATANDISVYLDGNELEFDVKPVIENDRTLVPLRVIFEALNADVDWDNSTRTVTATKGTNQIKLRIGDKTAYKNGLPITLDVPAKIVSDRTMIPVRFVSEAMGAKVQWDAVNRRVIITSVAVVESYLPLQIGNQWSYQGIGNEYAQYNDQVLYRSGNLVQLVRNNGGTRMVQIYEIHPNHIVCVYSEAEFYSNTNILNSFSPNRNEVILQSPLTEGTSWQVDGETYKIEATNVTVTTPAGTFNDCLEVHSASGNNYENIKYYAPGIGLVKDVWMDTNSNYQVISELDNLNIL